jgi:lia operon protein LiaG
MRHILSILTLVLPAALPAQQVERLVLEGRDVAVHNLVGTLRVEGGSGDRVVVEVTRKGREGGRLTLATGEVRGRQTLRVIYPSDRITYSEVDWFGRTSFTVNPDGTLDHTNDRDGGWHDRRRVEVDGRGTGLDAHADLRVLVPRGTTLALHLGIGETTIENVDAKLSVESEGMRVRASRIRGSLAVEAGSGGVEISDVTGDLTVESGSGGTTVNAVRGGALHLEVGSGGLKGGTFDVTELVAEVGSGGVRLSGVKTNRLRVEAGSGGSDVQLLAAVSDVSFEGGSGGVTLRLPESTSAAVDIEASSGSIQSDFEVSSARLEQRELHGTIGSGAGKIRIESGSGSVRLVKN